jgi:hypothetical protein
MADEQPGRCFTLTRATTTCHNFGPAGASEFRPGFPESQQTATAGDGDINPSLRVGQMASQLPNIKRAAASACPCGFGLGTYSKGSNMMKAWS